MERFSVKLLILGATFFVGVMAYYAYCFLPVSGERAQPATQIANIASTPGLNNSQEKPRETDFYAVPPCNRANPFRQDTMRAKWTASGGVVNGRIICGALPEYSPSATNVSGLVKVHVLIDQYGDVAEAHIISGHPLLHKSALRAARQTRFLITLLGGEIVKVRGILLYDYDKSGVSLQKPRAFRNTTP